MPLPIPLDDGVALASQQAFANVNNRFQEIASQQTLRSNAVDTFVKDQGTLQYLRGVDLVAAAAAQMIMGFNSVSANNVVAQRAARDQPNVSPTIAFVPSPVTADNPKPA